MFELELSEGQKMGIDWDRLKELFRWDDEGTIPMGWLAIMVVVGLVAGLKYGTTILYPSM